jgi:GNAT superfamily N-acetyltransferase
MAPLIRPARIEDAVGLSELLGVMGYPCPEAEAGARVLAVREDINQTLLVADWAGAVAGLVCCDITYYLPLGALTCRVTALAVSAAAQRQGIGRLLLREAEVLARAAGAIRIELTSASHRHDAHAFYRACGYGDGAVRFVKHLGDA